MINETLRELDELYERRQEHDDADAGANFYHIIIDNWPAISAEIKSLQERLEGQNFA